MRNPIEKVARVHESGWKLHKAKRCARAILAAPLPSINNRLIKWLLPLRAPSVVNTLIFVDALKTTYFLWPRNNSWAASLNSYGASSARVLVGERSSATVFRNLKFSMRKRVYAVSSETTCDERSLRGWDGALWSTFNCIIWLFMITLWGNNMLFEAGAHTRKKNENNQSH